MSFDHKQIEPKWQKYWEDNKTFKTDTSDFSKPKYYTLDMFPYPSGQGLHVGHPEGYTATDIVSRYKRMQGFNVLHPMGFDAFGLPAEQFAIKTGHHPAEFTYKNIDNFRRQIKSLGFSYDWDREIRTCDPDYYKWTQWIFKKMYDAGLAYISEMPVNWCPGLGTVLANEEVIDGKSERGGFPVYRKMMKQWVLKITDYAEKLLEGLDDIDWPESTKEMQRNWIGKSVGADVVFKIADTNKEFTVFTTRADTLFGATYCVMAPEHPFVDEITTPEQKEAVAAYKKEIATKSDLQRTDLNKDKTGVFTGAYAINPINGKKIPIWISDYVLITYGTGAIMAVPAHDTRDYEFAKKFDLPIIPVLEGGDIEKEAFTGDGKHINSGFLDGMGKQEAIDTMIKWLEEHHCGEKKVTYKLRDWLFSRQRYWGEPIPIIHMSDGTLRAVNEQDLPLELPATDNYMPSEEGESPLSRVKDWLNVEIDGVKGVRETNTMPQWAGSSWYFLRYVDNKNDKELVNREKADKYLPVDMYIGGVEHAVLHLLYSRFYTKFLHDIGVVDFDEPFTKLFNQGMICGRDRETGAATKMSKSLGNIVSPDDMVRDYGCDALRMYELFIGPPELDSIWDDRGIDGVYRFLTRFYTMVTKNIENPGKETPELIKLRHKMVYDITTRLESFSLNTVVSGFMEYNNKLVDLTKKGGVDTETLKTIVRLIAPFAPHMGEELWQQLGGTDTVFASGWPTYEEDALKDNEVTIPVQINGKTKATIDISVDDAKDAVIAKGKEAIADKLEGLNVIKEIYVPGKIVNIVAK